MLQNRKSKLEAVIEAAQKVIRQINEQELLAYFGMKTDPRPEAAAVKTYALLLIYLVSFNARFMVIV